MAKSDSEDVVDTEPLIWELCEKLFVLLCALSSLLPPLADGIVNGNPLFFIGPPIDSDGVWEVPMGVARLNFGGPALVGIDRAGIIGTFCMAGGAATELTVF